MNDEPGTGIVGFCSNRERPNRWRLQSVALRRAAEGDLMTTPAPDWGALHCLPPLHRAGNGAVLDESDDAGLGARDGKLPVPACAQRPSCKGAGGLRKARPS